MFYDIHSLPFQLKLRKNNYILKTVLIEQVQRKPTLINAHCFAILSIAILLTAKDVQIFDNA